MYFPFAVTIQTHTIPKEAPLFDRNFLTIMVHSYLEMSFVLSFCAFRHRGFATSTCCVFTHGQHSGGRDVFLLIQINNWTDWSILKCPAKIVGPTAFFFSLCSSDCLWCNLISPGQTFVCLALKTTQCNYLYTSGAHVLLAAL